jgi:hypothetical protein
MTLLLTPTLLLPLTLPPTPAAMVDVHDNVPCGTWIGKSSRRLPPPPWCDGNFYADTARKDTKEEII